MFLWVNSSPLFRITPFDVGITFIFFLFFRKNKGTHVYNELAYLEGRTAWGTKGVYAVSLSAARR